MKQNKFNIIIIFIVALLVMLPMFINSYHSNDDTMFHITNIIELTKNIKENVLFPNKIVGVIANNFGYGTNLFYPPLAHYTAAYLNFIINNPILSVKIIYLLGLFLSGITMYYLSKKMSKNNLVALVSAVIYMTLPYHLSDMYIRDASAEFLLFIFLPLIISGLYELFNGEEKKFYPLFIVGYVGGMLSHLTMMVYFTVLILLFLIFKFKETIKHLKPFIISSIFILTIVSPFLITIIEHKLLGNYWVFFPGVMVQGTQFNGLLPYKFISFIDDFRVNNIKYYIDIVTVILVFGTILNYKKLKNKAYNYVIIFALICMFTATLYCPWDLLPKSFRMIQYPWRMVTFVVLLVSLLAPLCITLLKDKNQKIVSFISIIGILTFTILGITYRNDTLLNLNDLWYEAGMGWQKEYIPVNVAKNINYYTNRSQDIIGNASFEIIENNVPSLKFTVATDETVEVELPRLYYLGYTLVDQDNNKYELYEDNYGFISTKLNSGTYTLKYTGTVIDNSCIIVSVISIGIFIWFVRRKNEKN